MAHILKLNEMIKNESSNSYLDGFKSRYPELYVSKEDKYYENFLNDYNERRARGTIKNYNDYNRAISGRTNYDIKEYVEKAKEHKYNGTISIPEEVLVNFYNMTDGNYHTEVRYEIALYLQQYSPEMYEFVSYFGNMVKDNKLKTGRYYTAFSIMDDLMFLKIDAIFGSKVAFELTTCL